MKYMRRPIPTRFFLSVIGLVILIYASLLVMAAGCMLAHADRSQVHHHHNNSEHESSGLNGLCAWACQATADTTVAIGPPLTVTEVVFGLTDLGLCQPVFSIHNSAVHSRAPPLSFLKLG